MAGWTDPITWVFKNALSATILNQQIRDNMIYLKKKPSDRAIIATDQTIAVTTWTKVTGSELQITIDATSDLIFNLNFLFQQSNGAAILNVDIYDADANVYLSSGTATPQTDGLGGYDASAAAVDQHLNVTFMFPDIADGAHNYEIYLKTSAATLTLNNDSALAYVAVWER